jgi:hypothetical protein
MGIEQRPHAALSRLRAERVPAGMIAAQATQAVALCLSLQLLPGVANADSMRCGSRLISEGDRIEYVLAHCGEPARKERSWIVRQPRFERGGREYSFPGTDEVPVDTWTYDFGPSRLMQRVRMVDGKVERIDTLEHGSSR